MSSKKMITLKSLDGRTVEVEEAVATKSLTIKNMIEDEDEMMEDEDEMMEDEDQDDCEDNGHKVIHLQKVTHKVLDKVIEYCKKHVDDEKVVNEDDIKAWDQDFVVKTDKSMLCNLLLAAYYLNIQSLLVLISKKAFHNKIEEGKAMEDMRILLACQP